MARVISEELFTLRFLVGTIPQEPIVVEAASVDAAIREGILFYADNPEFKGMEVRVLSSGPVPLDRL